MLFLRAPSLAEFKKTDPICVVFERFSLFFCFDRHTFYFAFTKVSRQFRY